MASTSQPEPAPRVPLTKERVVQAAIALADEAGVEGLTMRRLGHSLGVEAMSIYTHVANKDEILHGMLDTVVGEFEVPTGDPDWRTSLRQSALSAHQALLRHRWAAELLVLRSSDAGPAQVAYMDAVLGCLRRAGFSIDLTHHAYHALDFHLLGFTFQQVSFPLEGKDLSDLAEQFLEELGPDRYPHVAEHVRHHLEIKETGDGFVFGLDLILDGLERMR